jgi:hypothetical protein
MTQPEVRADDDTELEALRAERDALRAEVDALRDKPRQPRWWRQTTAALVVALACIVLTVSVVGLWARRNFLDTDRFVDRAGPLIEEPAVRSALSSRLTEQVVVLVDPEALFREALPERGQILAAPLASAVEGFVADHVESFLATDEFQRLWVAAITTAHEAAVRVLRDESEAVSTDGGTITLNLLPAVDAVLARITARSPEILGREVDLPDITVEDVPDAAITRIEDALGVQLDDDFGQFTVYDDGTLTTAQEAVALFDRFVVVLLPLGVALAALALWLSRRRRRTLLQVCAGLVIGMVVIRRVGFRLHDEVAALPPRAQGREATGLALDAFLHPLTTFGAWVISGALAVAAVALITGDYPWAVALRRRSAVLWGHVVETTSERARDEATVVWITEHRDALLVAGGVVGLAVLWWADLSWFGLLALVAIVGAYALLVQRIARHRDEPDATTPDLRSPSPPAGTVGGP